MLTYSTFSPSARLAPYVKTYWFLEGVLPVDALQPERIFPNGCMELIIHYGDAFKKLTGNSIEQQPAAFVYGQLQEYIELIPGVVSGVMGVQFFPNGLAHFTRLPVLALKQQAVELLHIFKHKSACLAEAIATAKTNMDKVGIMEQFLLDNLVHKKNHPGQMQAMIQDIYDAKGCIPVRYLMQKYHMSERQIERLFATEVGLSPKNFSSIIRFQQVFKLAPYADSLTSLSLEAGYFDQAHFARAFKYYTGYSPRQFFKGQHALASFFLDE
jgi:AraC-like DNA-binding protein